MVLDPALAGEWLDPATPKERAEQMMLHQGDGPEVFEWFKVGTALGNVKNHGESLIHRVT